MSSNGYKREQQNALFEKMAFIVGGGAILASIFFGNITPIIIAGITLFCSLSFMNGLT